MCGIAGIVRYDRPGSEGAMAVRQMLERQRHRGPDDADVHVRSFAVLGNVRLSFLDRNGGAQPMSDVTGRWWITYNGEIYNYRQLRKQLEGVWEFQSETDTEVVLAAIATWGLEALPCFNGMFSFFVWDEYTQTGLAARDRLGVKPFAYARQDGAFLFASEAKALLPALNGLPKADFHAVLEYLVAPYFSGVERAMFSGVEYLQPGHWLRIERGGIEIRPWWDWTQIKNLETDSVQATRWLANLAPESVRRVLVGDHPCATFMSGGLDSTLLAAVAAPLQAGPMTAYTIRFAGQEDFDYPNSRIVSSDDTPHARLAAETLGLDLHLVNVPREGLASDLAALAAINDALPAWEQELAQHHLSRAVSRTHRAVLVGDAADETHYGYPFLLDEEATRSPRGILERFGVAPIARNACADAVAMFDDQYRALAEMGGYSWETPLDRLLATTYLVVKRWLPRLLHNGDIHTMAFSVEARVPFADITLLALAARLHPNLAIHNGGEKCLLRQAVRGLVPEPIRLRRKSALPKDQGTSAVYRIEATRAVRESHDFLATWLDLGPIERLLASDRTFTENERSLLFRIVALHHWRHAFHVSPP